MGTTSSNLKFQVDFDFAIRGGYILSWEAVLKVSFTLHVVLYAVESVKLDYLQLDFQAP